MCRWTIYSEPVKPRAYFPQTRDYVLVLFLPQTQFALLYSFLSLLLSSGPEILLGRDCSSAHTPSRIADYYRLQSSSSPRCWWRQHPGMDVSHRNVVVRRRVKSFRAVMECQRRSWQKSIRCRLAQVAPRTFHSLTDAVFSHYTTNANQWVVIECT